MPLTIPFHIFGPDTGPEALSLLDNNFSAIQTALNSLSSVGTTAAEIAAGVTPVDFTHPPADVNRYLVNTIPGTTDMTAGFLTAWAAYKTIYAPASTYLVDTITVPSTFFQRKLYGDGPGRTVLSQKTAANDTLVLGSGGTAEHTIEFADFSMVGLGSSTGSGIRIPVNTPNPAFNFRVKKVTITGYGGRGIYGLGATFNSIFEGVQVDNCNDHQFDLLGGNTLVFLNCYAERVPTAGKAGYRIHGAKPVFIGCTGINSGQYWGVFGDTVAEDGVLGFCQPTLIGCDMESFTVGGLRNKTGGCTIIGTAIIVAAGTAYGVQVDGANNPGFIDNYDGTFQLSGGAWTNGVPIHQSASGVNLYPFMHVGKWTGTPDVPFYNDADAVSRTMSADMQGLIVSNRFAKKTYDHYVLGLLRNAYSGTATFAAATTVAVSFGTAQPDTTYGVNITGSANKTFWVTTKTVNGFTINASSSSSDTVDWFVFRVG